MIVLAIFKNSVYNRAFTHCGQPLRLLMFIEIYTCQNTDSPQPVTSSYEQTNTHCIQKKNRPKGTVSLCNFVRLRNYFLQDWRYFVAQATRLGHISKQTC